MEKTFRQAAEAGRIHSSWAQKFYQYHAVVELRPDDDCRTPLLRAGLEGKICTTGALRAKK